MVNPGGTEEKTIRVCFDVQDMAECLAEKIHQKRQEEEPVVDLTQAVFICSSPKITEEASDYLKSKNQVIYGIGYSDEVLQGIREGKVEGVMAYSMYSFGIYAVKSAIYSIERKWIISQRQNASGSRRTI